MSDATPRKSARQILALVALATDLPLPRTITFHSDAWLSLEFDTARDGQTWVMRLGGELRENVSEGTRHVGQQMGVTWHGWAIHCYGTEPAEPVDEIPDERAALTELADGGEPS